MKKILLIIIIASFGFIFPAASATAQTPVPATVCADTYIVRSGDTLRGIAQKCKVTVKEIMQLNDFIEDPNLIYSGWVLDMPRDTDSPVVIPETGAATVSNAFYVVKSGDTLPYIARRLDVLAEDIMAANPQVDSNADLYTGQILELPGANDEPAAAVAPRVIEPGQIVNLVAQGFEANSALLIAGGPLGEVEQTLQTVKANQNGSLRVNVLVPMDAERGKRWTFIVRAVDDAKVQARTNLVYVVDTTGPNDSIIYTVRLNDTLSGIAVKFGVTQEEILEENPQITSASIVYVGQDILIPGPELREE